MKLLCILLALLAVPEKPVTEDGFIDINRQIGGKPIEYLLRSQKFDSARIPLIVDNWKLETTIEDVAEYNIPVTVTGVLIEQQFRSCLVVTNITLTSK